MKIAQKLTLFFLINSLIPAILIGIFSYFNTQRSLNEQINTQINNTLNRQTSQITELMTADLHELSVVPSIRETVLKLDEYVQNQTPENLSALTISLKEDHLVDTRFRRIHLLSDKGIVITSTDSKLIGKDYHDSEVFSKGKTAPDVSLFFRDSDGELAQYLIRNISYGGKVIGYLLLEAPIDRYALVTSNYDDLGKTGETLLLRKVDTHTFQYLTPPRFNETIALTDFAQKSSGLDYRDKSVLSVQRDVPGTPWIVEVKMDKSEIYRPLHTLRNLTIATIGLASVAVIFAALYFAGRITRPIQKFTDIVKRIQGGDYGLRVPIESRDEIGTLGVAFNDMTNQLAESNRALELKVTERTQALNQKVQELGNAKAKDDAILDSIGDGMLVTDNSGHILLVNSIAANFLGVDKNRVVSGLLSAIPLYDEHDKLIPPEAMPTAMALQTGRKVQLNVWSISPTKRKTALAVTATPVLQNGMIIGTIQTIRDVTKEKEIDRMKTEFISLASHQLRTPLSAIRWFTEMLLGGDVGKLNDEQAEFAKKSVSKLSLGMVR